MFMKGGAVNKYGCDLVSINIQDKEQQLIDKELVIGDAARKSLATLKPERQKVVILGIR